MGAEADKVLYSELTRFLFSLVIVEESRTARLPGDIHRISGALHILKSAKGWKDVYSDRKYWNSSSFSLFGFL